MNKLIQILKALVVAFVLGNFIFSSFIARLLIPGKSTRRRFFAGNVSRFSRVLLHVFGIELVIENLERWSPEKNLLVLSNHMSYIDALAVAAVHPVCFVTSIEVKNTPFLGLLSELAGALYVERRSRENLTQEIGEISEALREDFSVVIFPEATSTNGSSVLPFKRSLLAAAVEAKRPVLPVAINFESIDSAPVTATNRDLLCWYGEMDFGPHLWKLLQCKKIRIRISLLEEIPITAETTRDTLVEAAYRAIHSTFRPIV